MIDMTKGSPARSIIKFAIPVLIGNLFNLAYSIADIRIIGSYIGEEALSAVGSVSTLHDLLISLIVGLSGGFAVITARYFGMKDDERVRTSSSRSLLLGVGISLLLMLSGFIFLKPIFTILHVPASDMAGASSYFGIILIGLPFSALYNVPAANLRAIGDSYTPLVFLIISAVLNIIMDIIAVGSMGLGVGGAAGATVIAQFLSAVSLIIYAYVRYKQLRPQKGDLHGLSEMYPELLAGGISMSLMSALVAFGTLILQTAINTLGSNTIVAHSATRKLCQVYMLPFSVFGTTMATYCGQNAGAGRPDRIREGIKGTLLVSIVWCVLCLVTSYTIVPHLIRLMTDTDTPEIIDKAWRYQKFDSIFYFVPLTISVLRNSLQGMGDHRTPVISSGLELIVKAVFAYVFTPIFAYNAIIVCEPVVWFIMVVPLIISTTKRLRVNT